MPVPPLRIARAGCALAALCLPALAQRRPELRRGHPAGARAGARRWPRSTARWPARRPRSRRPRTLPDPRLTAGRRQPADQRRRPLQPHARLHDDAAHRPDAGGAQPRQARGARQPARRRASSANGRCWPPRSSRCSARRRWPGWRATSPSGAWRSSATSSDENRLLLDTLAARIAAGKAHAGRADDGAPGGAGARRPARRRARDVAKARAALRRWVGARADEPLAGEPPRAGGRRRRGARRPAPPRRAARPTTRCARWRRPKPARPRPSSAATGPGRWSTAGAARSTATWCRSSSAFDLPWQRDQRQQPQIAGQAEGGRAHRGRARGHAAPAPRGDREPARRTAGARRAARRGCSAAACRSPPSAWRSRWRATRPAAATSAAVLAARREARRDSACALIDLERAARRPARAPDHPDCGANAMNAHSHSRRSLAGGCAAGSRRRRASALAAGVGARWRGTGAAPRGRPRPPPSAAGERKVLYWYDPMVPTQKFDKPGKSPFMDMQLVPRYADEGDAQPAACARPSRRRRSRRSACGWPAVEQRAVGAAVDAVGTRAAQRARREHRAGAHRRLRRARLRARAGRRGRRRRAAGRRAEPRVARRAAGVPGRARHRRRGADAGRARSGWCCWACRPR